MFPLMRFPIANTNTLPKIDNKIKRTGKKKGTGYFFVRIGRICMERLVAWIPAFAPDPDPGFAGMTVHTNNQELRSYV
ncbi:hypothetical protein D4R47_00050 [archaeon]|nr:MAG: hypothetical protein D4R47_00050 [archaeon]